LFYTQSIMKSISNIIILVSMLYAGSAYSSDHVEARTLVESGAILPLEVILNQAKTDHPGRILEVSLDHEKEGYVYELELVDEKGRVWELEYDAATGKLLEKEREDD